jgi:zinc transport system substrate-binding protein
MSKQNVFLMVLLTLSVISCKQRAKEPATLEQKAHQTLVFASNYPLYYFAKQMGGDFINLEFPATESVDPAHWLPEPLAISRMQQADLILLNGASYEKWLGKVSLPSSRLVNTTEGLENSLIPLEETVTHSHGPGGEHEHTGTAMTTWLDLPLAVEQARSVMEALVTKIPEQKSEIEAAFTRLEEELIKLDQDLLSIASSNPNQHVVFSHPVYQYLENRYKIKGTSLHWEPDIMPDDEQWKELSHLIEHHPGSIMIWEGEPLPEISGRLESMGIQKMVFEPCANMPEEGDFLSIMKRNVQHLRNIY